MFEGYPELRIEHRGKLLELLHHTKLFICDHQSTGFMEALVLNTPTILLWDTAMVDERRGATPVFDSLREAGILFHDPVLAAENINGIWSDVQSWWSHPDRQGARRDFIKWSCWVDEEWQYRWVAAFSQIGTD